MYKPTYYSLWAYLFLLLSPLTQATLGTQQLTHVVPSLAPMLKQTMPAVVNISSSQTQVINNPLFNDPFFRRFFNIPEQKREKQSRGSGVIIDARRGYVITNDHVIEKADKISVTLLDGRKLKAELIGTDPETDIALLKIPSDNLTALSLGDSEKLQVGDFVVAIGNPFGLGQTVTSGIVSALGRSGLGIEGYEDFIQTDASINPGNSGGALVNLEGQLIGINTAIIAPGGGNVGIGFSIPSNMVSQIIGHLIEFGEIQRGTIGIQIQDLTPELAQAFSLKNSKGAVISQVKTGTSADTAGLRSGDIVISVNENQIDSATDLRNRLGLMRVGERVKITVIRNKYTKNFYVRITDNKVQGGDISLYLDGTTLRDTSAGIKIEKVEPRSNAEKIGLEKADILIGFSRRKVENLSELKQYFNRYHPRSLEIQRGNETLSIRID